MISSVVAFLVMLNPFAMFLYLSSVREELNIRDFLKVLFRATLISFTVFLVFMLTGNFLFTDIFQIEFSSFRMFGGVIIFSFAYLFIIKGQKAFIMMKGSLDDLAEEIALPFMVGAGTIYMAVLMAKELPLYEALIGLVVVMTINYLIILFLTLIRDALPKKDLRIAFDKNMGILLRLNGFFLGAIGINMIFEGARVFFG